MSSPQNRVELGTILRPHGLKGAVFVGKTAGKESAFQFVKEIFLENAAEAVAVEEAYWMPKGWKVKLSSIESIEDAKKIVGNRIFAARESLPALDENAFYLHDLVGFEAMDEQDRSVGFCDGFETGGNSQWIRITTSSGELLVPFHSHFVLKVLTNEKKIRLKNLSEIPHE